MLDIVSHMAAVKNIRFMQPYSFAEFTLQGEHEMRFITKLTLENILSFGVSSMKKKKKIRLIRRA